MLILPSKQTPVTAFFFTRTYEILNINARSSTYISEYGNPHVRPEVNFTFHNKFCGNETSSDSMRTKSPSFDVIYKLDPTKNVSSY